MALEVFKKLKQPEIVIPRKLSQRVNRYPTTLIQLTIFIIASLGITDSKDKFNKLGKICI